MKFARLSNDIVVDLFDKLDGQVHPDLHGEFVQVPDTTEIGFVKNGEQYEAPVVEEVEIQEAPPPAPSISKREFIRRFTFKERIAHREAAATDPTVAEFMYVLDLDDAVKLTDANLIEALAYLETNSLLAAGRKDEILSVPTAATPEE